MLAASMFVGRYIRGDDRRCESRGEREQLARVIVRAGLRPRPFSIVDAATGLLRHRLFFCQIIHR